MALRPYPLAGSPSPAKEMPAIPQPVERILFVWPPTQTDRRSSTLYGYQLHIQRDAIGRVCVYKLCPCVHTCELNQLPVWIEPVTLCVY